MELVLDRDGAAFPLARQSALPIVLVPLESTVVELESPSLRTRVDRSSLAIVPRRTRYRLGCESPAPKLVTLSLPPETRALAAEEYAPYIDAARLERLVAAPRLLARTRWVDELVHRYVFERDVCKKHHSAAARFCELELTKELYFVAAEERAPVVHQGSALVERARALIEAELFAPLSTAKLARRCHASESALLRAFRRELGVPPSAYVRARRLDEALLLIESGRYSVGEVAERVGYHGQAAFAAAFHKKFRMPPSQVIKASRSR
jgi:AraC-like DNA-binding protein